MPESKALVEVADKIRELAREAPAPIVRGENVEATVSITIVDPDRDPSDPDSEDPDVVYFWGKLAVEVAKAAAAGIVRAVGGVLGSCKTTETTTVTENADGSTSTKTVRETTCTAT